MPITVANRPAVPDQDVREILGLIAGRLLPAVMAKLKASEEARAAAAADIAALRQDVSSLTARLSVIEAKPRRVSPNIKKRIAEMTADQFALINHCLKVTGSLALAAKMAKTTLPVTKHVAGIDPEDFAATLAAMPHEDNPPAGVEPEDYVVLWTPDSADIDI